MLLQGAQFRQLNEQLYTQSSTASFTMMKKAPRLFETVCSTSHQPLRSCRPVYLLYLQYHAGFRSQVNGWPINPLDIIIDEVRKLPPGAVVADMGCGEARLAATLAPKNGGPGGKISVHSFDLVCPPGNPYITPCDIAQVPLASGSCDVVVFCLSLMGTNYADFLREADRLLKPGGKLLIAEVRSRFDSSGGTDRGGHAHQQAGSGAGGAGGGGKHAGGGKRPRPQEDSDEQAHVSSPHGSVSGITAFVDGVTSLGFKATRRDESNTMFVLLFFRKHGGSQGNPNKPVADMTASSASAAAAQAGDGGRAKKKRSKHNKFKAHAEEGGQDLQQSGAHEPSALPSLKACVYKKR